MDTGTHIVMGIGLTALAMHDPTLSDHFGAAATTLIAGSLIPDSDTVLKLKIMLFIYLIIEVSHIQYLSLYYGRYL